ncbi:MAG: sulfatase-like hydrolase/transferase, partial [Candidatus Latescibacterota bacterium]|nr:sulfatase-like hydrolase/transferase [Candidatus Latescibacterota bacterium]
MSTSSPHRITRRDALARLGTGAAALGAASLSGGCGLLGRRPNVILFLADDLGSNDLGCFGAPDLITPHIDGLAKRSLKFTQAYATAPACTPSRISLLTGRHAPRALDSGDGLVPEETTIAEMLGRVGYRTACFGKWHLGGKKGMLPGDQGFDEFLGHRVG